MKAGCYGLSEALLSSYTDTFTQSDSFDLSWDVCTRGDFSAMDSFVVNKRSSAKRLTGCANRLMLRLGNRPIRCLWV